MTGNLLLYINKYEGGSVGLGGCIEIRIQEDRFPPKLPGTTMVSRVGLKGVRPDRVLEDRRPLSYLRI